MMNATWQAGPGEKIHPVNFLYLSKGFGMACVSYNKNRPGNFPGLFLLYVKKSLVISGDT